MGNHLMCDKVEEGDRGGSGRGVTGDEARREEESSSCSL